MARETKIGLLAGLAFIICFAVILSQRGRISKPTQGIFSRTTQTTQRKPKHRPMISESRRDVLPVVTSPSGSGQLVTHSLDESQNESNSLDNDPFEPSGSGADVHLPSWVNTTEPTTDAQPSTENFSLENFSLNESNINNQIARDVRNVQPVQPMNAQQRKQLLEQRLSELNLQKNIGNVRSNNSDSSQTNTQASPFQISRKQQTVEVESVPPFTIQSTPNSNTKNMGLRYVVISGDSLSKIAAKFYGVESHRHIDAIFNANRKVMVNPDTLKVGMVLRLPGVGKSSDSDQQHTFKKQTHRSKKSSVTRNQPKQTYRWYQIKKNDRYASIAREQLGDANRWRELYDLNREKFPDPQRIREGVRIKIPIRSGKMVSRNRP